MAQTGLTRRNLTFTSAALKSLAMNLLPQLLRPQANETVAASPATREGETVHRLQVGLLTLGAMVLLVGVADMIMDRAQLAEDSAVPEAAPTVEPSPKPTEDSALRDAGVVPDLPADVEAEPVPQGPVVPEQGDASPAQGQ